MFGAIAGGIASALAGGAMSKLFGGGQKAASGGIQGDVLATDNNTVGMGDAEALFDSQIRRQPYQQRKHQHQHAPSIKLRKCSSKIITSILSFISGRLATKSNQIKQLIRNGRSASLQRTFKKSFTSFSHSTRNKTRDGLIRVRNIRALNGRFNTSITHAYSIVIGSKHITLNATGGGFLTASKQFRHGATSKSR